MIAANYSTVRNNLDIYYDMVTNEYETVIVTREDEKNAVILSLSAYNSLARAAKNKAYLDMIDRSMEQLARGEGTVRELIEVDDD